MKGIPGDEKRAVIFLTLVLRIRAGICLEPILSTIIGILYLVPVRKIGNRIDSD